PIPSPAKTTILLFMYLLLSHIKVFIFRKPKNESDYRHVYYPTKHDEKELTASLILIPRTKRTVKSWTSILSHVKVCLLYTSDAADDV
ncbi:hypothetical protein KQJ29_34785, partial [Enterococcus sp. S181_ASV_20]|nr:hypothetical protein [Enterococcus sp. S181_ASV_20]